MADATRVALLARPGEACERLRAALREAGGDIVLEADPSTLSVDALSAAAPQTVLVALDPAVEDALDRFDAVLGNPAVAVIFDEADLAARREGWDAARWVRHLSAKLHRHHDVLPPGREPDGADAPAAQPALAPVDGMGAGGAAVEASQSVPSLAAAAADFEGVVIEHLPALGLEAAPETALAFDAPAASGDPDHASGVDALAGPNPLDLPADDAFAGVEVVELSTDEASAFGSLAFTDDINEMSLEGDVPASAFDDAGFESLLAGLEAPEAEAPRIDLQETGLDEFLAAAPDVARDLAAELPPAPATTPPSEPAPARFSFGELSLVDEDAAAAPGSAPTPASGKFQHDIADLERRIATLGLADGPDGPAPAAAPLAAPSVSPVAVVLPPIESVPAATEPRVAPAAAAPADGAVLILAGIGGPDAVRQILSALPATFSRPVLISQRLDGGRHDRLVQQMGRAAVLPVQLAQAGARAEAGHVYIVPPDVGLAVRDGLQFEPATPLLPSLPAGESAVLLLSGADPALVEDALAKGAQGALVAGQSPEGCYDAAAPIALTTRGGTAGTPQELVQRLLQRWPA